MILFTKGVPSSPRRHALSWLCLLIVFPVVVRSDNPHGWTPSVSLADNLDEPDNNGFCPDISGRPGQSNFDCEGTLQGHSCKPTGDDTQFQYDKDAKRLKAYNYDISCQGTTTDNDRPCVEVSGNLVSNAELTLAVCDDSEEKQNFIAKESGSGHLLKVGKSSDDLCLGVGSTMNDAGPFKARDLLILDCTAAPEEQIVWTVTGLDDDDNDDTTPAPAPSGGPYSSTGWRLLTKKANLENGQGKDNWAVKEVEFYDDDSCTGNRLINTNYIESGNASGQNGNTGPDKVFDNDYATNWGGKMDGDELLYVGLTFNTPVSVQCLIFQDDFAKGRSTDKVWIQALDDDDATWIDLVEAEHDYGIKDIIPIPSSPPPPGTDAPTDAPNQSPVASPPTGGGDSYTQWRLWTENDHVEADGKWTVSELEFYSSSDCSGTKLTVTETYIESKHVGQKGPKDAFDGNVNTGWAGRADGEELFIGIDFETPTNVYCVRFKDRASFGAEKVKVQASEDGTSWSDMTDLVDSDVDDWLTIPIDSEPETSTPTRSPEKSPVASPPTGGGDSYPQWRLHTIQILLEEAPKWAVSELEFYNSDDCSGSKLTVTEKYIESKSVGSKGPKEAFDDNENSSWAGRPDGEELYIGIDFETPTNVLCVRFKDRKSMGANMVKVQASEDGTSWSDMTSLVDIFVDDWIIIPIDSEPETSTPTKSPEKPIVCENIEEEDLCNQYANCAFETEDKVLSAECILKKPCSDEDDKKKCKKLKYCSWDKGNDACNPETDCFSLSKKKCKKDDFCAYENDMCVQACTVKTKKSKCKKVKFSKSKICKFKEEKNPCFKKCCSVPGTPTPTQAPNEETDMPTQAPNEEAECAFIKNPTGQITNNKMVNRNPDCTAYVGDYTATVDDKQEGVKLNMSFKITSDANKCVLTSNNIPHHDVGESTTNGKNFATPVAPNDKPYVLNVPRNPVKGNSPNYMQKIGGKLTLNGIMLNGVDLDMDSAFCYNPAFTSSPDNISLGVKPGEPKCGLNAHWYAIPAANPKNVVLDNYTGHSYGGRYHYHGDNTALSYFNEDDVNECGSPVIGWAPDGFPIYGHWYYDAGTKEVKEATSSWQIKEEYKNGRTKENFHDFDPPSIDKIALGRLVEDWEYVEDSGTLDECNGMFDSDDNYHYRYTTEYPYGNLCTMGTPDPSFEKSGCDYDSPDNNNCNRKSFITSVTYYDPHDNDNDHGHSHEATTSSGTEAFCSVGVAAVITVAGANMMNLI